MKAVAFRLSLADPVHCLHGRMDDFIPGGLNMTCAQQRLRHLACGQGIACTLMPLARGFCTRLRPSRRDPPGTRRKATKEENGRAPVRRDGSVCGDLVPTLCEKQRLDPVLDP